MSRVIVVIACKKSNKTYNEKQKIVLVASKKRIWKEIPQKFICLINLFFFLSLDIKVLSLYIFLFLTITLATGSHFCLTHSQNFLLVSHSLTHLDTYSPTHTHIYISYLTLLTFDKKFIHQTYSPTTSISPDTMAVWNEGASTDISQVNLPDIFKGTANRTTWLWLERLRWKRKNARMKKKLKQEYENNFNKKKIIV